MGQAEPKNDDQQFSQRSALYLLTQPRQNLARLNPRYARPNECAPVGDARRGPSWLSSSVSYPPASGSAAAFWKVLPPAWESDTSA